MDDSKIRALAPIFNVTTLQMMKAGFFFGLFVAILTVLALLSILSFSVMSVHKEGAELNQEQEAVVEHGE